MKQWWSLRVGVDAVAFPFVRTIFTAWRPANARICRVAFVRALMPMCGGLLHEFSLAGHQTPPFLSWV
jgi:hypothetical protein